MEVHFTPNWKAARVFEEDARFAAAVESGEYLTHEQVAHRLQRLLRPQ
jgi:hypothetical protein